MRAAFPPPSPQGSFTAFITMWRDTLLPPPAMAAQDVDAGLPPPQFGSTGALGVCVWRGVAVWGRARLCIGRTRVHSAAFVPWLLSPHLAFSTTCLQLPHTSTQHNTTAAPNYGNYGAGAPEGAAYGGEASATMAPATQQGVL